MGDKIRVEDLLARDLEIVTGVEWARDYKPCPIRRWKCDLACVSQKIAIEVDGRFHAAAKQQRSDAEKANYLALRGWRGLRYPASSVLTNKRRERIVEQIHRLLCGVVDIESDSCVLNGE